MVLEEALAIARDLEEEIIINNTLVQLGAVVLAGCDPIVARQLQNEALMIGRRLHFAQGIADALVGLGDVEWTDGDLASAAAAFGEGLKYYMQDGARQTVPAVLERCAGLCVEVRKFETAARLFGVADALFELTPACIPPRSQRQHQHDLALDRAALGDNAFSRLWQQGRTENLQRAVDGLWRRADRSL